MKKFYLIVLVMSFFISCDNSNEEREVRKVYDLEKILKMDKNEVIRFHPELNMKILKSKEGEDLITNKVENLDIDNYAEIVDFLDKERVDENFKNLFLEFYNYSYDVKKTRVPFTKEQQECLDAYALRMSQIRRRTLINFLFNPFEAFFEAKLDMQEAYEERELCMKHANSPSKPN